MTLSRRALLGSVAAGTAAGIGVSAESAFTRAPLLGQRQILPASADDGTDVIYQTSFETDEADWLEGPTIYDDTVAHTGDRSLRYDRSAGDSYVTATMIIPAEAGVAYELTCWVRAVDLEGPAIRGAKVGLDAFSATGWLKGSYSLDVRSDDWVQAQVLFTPPEGTEELAVQLYLYSEVDAGTAWFDDLTLRAIKPRQLHTELHTPSYRGLVIPGDHDTIELRSSVETEDLSAHQVTVSLLTAADELVDQTTVEAAETLDYSYSTDGLAAGRHTLRIELINKATGQTVEAEEWGLEKLTSAPPTYFDRHGRFIRDGEPYFPIGLYHGGLADALETINGTPFDTILPYAPPTKAALDLAEANGVNVIYPLMAFFHDSASAYKPAEIVTEADEVPAILDRVERFGDHPAMLAWYMADEPKSLLHERLKVHYDAVASHDPHHPAYLEHALAELPRDDQRAYVRMLDVSGAASYPIYDDTSDVGEPTTVVRGQNAALANRPAWHVPQAFSWEHYNRVGRFPTGPEFRSMTWQFICEGTSGLIYYMLSRLQQQEAPDVSVEEAWDIAVTTAEEVHGLIPVLLSIDTAPEATLSSEDWLNTLLKSHAGKGYLLTVNHTRDSQTATFTVPAALSVSVRDEDRTVSVGPDGSFSDDYDPMAVHHYEIELVDFGSLTDRTVSELQDFGAPSQQGVARSARQLLTKAAATTRVNKLDEAGQHLAAYRSMITSQQDHTLSPDQVQTLIRLSHHLPTGKDNR